MKLSNLLIAGTMLAGVAIANVNTAQAGPCPVLTTDPNGLNGACNLTVTFGPNSAITTTVNSAITNYDGADDALIGVVNNSGKTLNSFMISSPGVDIFGFDGDGIDSYVPIPQNAVDTTGYGGPLAYFTGINATLDSGIVNFIGGLADGATTYFSLEESININAPPIIGPVPEPATLGVLGVGMIGAAIARRRRRT